MNKDDKVNKDYKVDNDDEVDKDDKMDKDDEDNKEEEENMDKMEEEEEIFFAKILKMAKCTSLPNKVRQLRLSQWEQVSEYIVLHSTFTVASLHCNREKRYFLSQLLFGASWLIL